MTKKLRYNVCACECLQVEIGLKRLKIEAIAKNKFLSTKYMIRPLLSLERLSFSEKEGKVCYRYGESPEEVEWMDYP